MGVVKSKVCTGVGESQGHQRRNSFLVGRQPFVVLRPSKDWTQLIPSRLDQLLCSETMTLSVRFVSNYFTTTVLPGVWSPPWALRGRADRWHQPPLMSSAPPLTSHFLPCCGFHLFLVLMCVDLFLSSHFCQKLASTVSGCVPLECWFLSDIRILILI